MIRNKSGHFLNKATISLRAALQELFVKRGIDLTIEQWAILGIVWSFQEKLNSKKLCDLFFKDKSTVSRNLKKLEAKDLIEFLPSQDDSREKNIMATKKALAMQGKVYKSVEDVLTIAEEGVSAEELRITIEVLKKMDSNLTRYLKESIHV